MQKAGGASPSPVLAQHARKPNRLRCRFLGVHERVCVRHGRHAGWGRHRKYSRHVLLSQETCLILPTVSGRNGEVCKGSGRGCVV